MNTTAVSIISGTTHRSTSSTYGCSLSKSLYLYHPIILTLSSGFWLILPTYMIWVFGNNILDGLAMASGQSVKKSLE